MSRSSPSQDNLFLRSYTQLRQRSSRFTYAVPLLVVIPLLSLLLLTLIIGKVQLRNDIAVEADRVGAALARQIASTAAEPLAAGDNLSLNILLAEWNQNPLIAHVSLYSPNNRILAEAGNRPAAHDRAPGQGRYMAAVLRQDEVAGQVQLILAAKPFGQPASHLINQLSVTLLLITLIAGLLAWWWAARLRRDLAAIARWDQAPVYPAPASTRHDELGDFARALTQQRGLYPEPEPEPEPAPQPESVVAPESVPEAASAQKAAADGDSEPLTSTESHEEQTAEAPGEQAAEADADSSDDNVRQDDLSDEQELTADTSDTVSPDNVALAHHAMLAVRLGNQDALRRLPRPRLMALLERYREHVQRAAHLYAGQQHTLYDGTSVLLFSPGAENTRAELAHGLCCGELLRVLGHDLQIEIADTGIALHLQLALCHAPGLENISDEGLSEHELCQRTFDQLQHSRNLLLVDAELATAGVLAESAVARRLASQPGIYCIERLLEPYQSMVESQLNKLYNQRQG
ncbi:MAG: hypothetical protein V7756_06610 [Halopseudomonas sp.]|uniref:hypothetical protein n=1 Tax=Halopseudomonas sp. TaxID=2901191 RepID=UPI0030015D6D